MSVATVPRITQPTFRLGHRPALDGLRAVAVTLVVFFHLDVGVLTGGYLGVSIFFTLSGFLITSLLLERHAETGRLDLGRFYVRRIKRLVPASTLTLVAIVVVSGIGGFVTTERSRGDLVAASTNVFNWRQLASGRAYAHLFAGDSPVAHFWSLAIEEQFYVVWPLLILGLLRLGTLTAQRVTTVAITLFIVAAFTSFTGSSAAAYFASWSRAAEILAGAALAGTVAAAGSVPAWCRSLAVPAMIIVVVSSVLTPAANGWAYSGGLPWFSLVSVALIAGVLVPGPMTSVLSRAPLGALGRVSYGVYLVHWPVFVLVNGDRSGLGGVFLVLVRLGVTALISTAMYLGVERPIRSGDRPGRLATAICGTATSAAIVVAVAFLVIEPPVTATAVAQTIEAGETGFVDFSTADSSEATAALPDIEDVAPRVLVVGSDPTALQTLQNGLTSDVEIVNGVQPGCAIDHASASSARCEPTLRYVERVVRAEASFDAVVVSLGPADEVPVAIDGQTTAEEIIEIARRSGAVEDAVNDVIAAVEASTSLILVSFWGDSASTASALGRIVVERADVDGVFDDAAAMRHAVQTRLVDPPTGRGTRVLVLGDSTSLVLAQALDSAGDDLDVVWAGDNGCPIVRATLLQAEPNSDPRQLDCPDFEEKLPAIVESFRPHIVLVMAGPTELADLAFEGDRRMHRPGSDEWIGHHDREFDDLLDALTPMRGQRPSLVLADTPPIDVGPYSTAELTRPERLIAWNVQIQRWARRHARVDVWPYAAALLEYERVNGTIRLDGVHAEPTLLAPLVEGVVADWVGASSR